MQYGYVDISYDGIMQRCVGIPNGSFMMGSPDNDKEAYVDEKPQRLIHIHYPFYMADTPCTVALWNAVMPEQGKNGVNSQFPVTDVSYYDALEFCHRLSQHTRMAVCLPTEEQWEYACRASTATRYNVGDTLTKEHANISADGVSPVGCYPPNAWGLYDMHGNVYEWTCSLYSNTAATARVIRGGSWIFNASSVRAASRNRLDPSIRFADLGFRFIVHT